MLSVGLHYLNKIQNLGERPGESNEDDRRLRNIASEKRPKKLGLFRLEKKNVRGSITASKCQAGWAVQAMWHCPCFLGDGDGGHCSWVNGQRTRRILLSVLLKPLGTGLCGVRGLRST